MATKFISLNHTSNGAVLTYNPSVIKLTKTKDGIISEFNPEEFIPYETHTGNLLGILKHHDDMGTEICSQVIDMLYEAMNARTPLSFEEFKLKINENLDTDTIAEYSTHKTYTDICALKLKNDALGVDMVSFRWKK